MFSRDISGVLYGYMGIRDYVYTFWGMGLLLLTESKSFFSSEGNVGEDNWGNGQS